MTGKWTRWVTIFMLAALAISVAGCTTEPKQPTPDQPSLPLTASWKGADEKP